jgi:hypothetical protein
MKKKHKIKWLDIIWKGKLVKIDGKGRIKKYGKHK